MLELIQQKKVFHVPFFNGMIGLRVAIGLMDESIDEALAVLEGLEDPAAKAIGFIRGEQQTGHAEPGPGARGARPGSPECPGGEGARRHAGWC